MRKKQKSLEVLVTSMRHKMKIKNTCTDFVLLMYWIEWWIVWMHWIVLLFGVRVSFKLHFAEGPEIHHVTQTNRTGHNCPSVPVWRLGLCEMVGQFPCKLSGEDHSKSWLVSLMPGLLAENSEFTAPKLETSLLKQPENRDWCKSGLCDLNGSFVPFKCTVGHHGSDLVPKFVCGFTPKCIQKINPKCIFIRTICQGGIG